jgi:hypothetical protein
MVRNSLLTYFKNWGLGNFVRVFVWTAFHCTTRYRAWGLIRFLGSAWRYIPQRFSTQRRRRVSDAALSIFGAGIPLHVPFEPKDE